MIYFVLLTTLEILFVSSQMTVWLVDADSNTSCQQGMVDGRNIPESLWEDSYNSDCSLVRIWADDVDSMFKGGTGSEEKSYNQCAKIEAEKVVDEKIEGCLTPAYCADEGKEAAAVIMAIYTAPFCNVNAVSSTYSEKKPSIEKKCKEYAIASCKTYLPQAYRDVRAISSCSDDIEDYVSWDLLEELERECEDMVEDLTEV